jgi:hypothetical protein
MSEALKDIALAVVIFVIGLAALLQIQFGPGQALQNSQDAQITFKSFPTAISALLMLLSGLFAATSALPLLRSRSGSPGTGAPETAASRPSDLPPPKFLLLRAVALVGLLVAFAMLIGRLPLFVLVSVFLFAAFFIFGQTRPLRMALIAIVGGVLFHLLFVVLLKLPLN